MTFKFEWKTVIDSESGVEVLGFGKKEGQIKVRRVDLFSSVELALKEHPEAVDKTWKACRD